MLEGLGEGGVTGDWPDGGVRRGPGGPPYGLVGLVEEGAEVFVLVGGDEVDAGGEGGFPAEHGGIFGPEVVAGCEAFIFGGGEAIERVEANPEAEMVGAVDESPEAAGIGGCPLAGAGLAAVFDL